MDSLPENADLGSSHHFGRLAKPLPAQALSQSETVPRPKGMAKQGLAALLQLRLNKDATVGAGAHGILSRRWG